MRPDHREMETSVGVFEINEINDRDSIFFF